jgi:hypothetical protein
VESTHTPEEDTEMNDDSRTTFLMITALVFALAAMFAASPAGARPIDLDGTELTAADRATSVRPDDQGGPIGVGAVTSSSPIWMKALQVRSEALEQQTYEQALQARSEALDRYYGPQQDNATYVKALQARSEALDRYYGLGNQPQTETKNSGWYTGLEYSDMQPVQTSSDDGFAWGKATFGIGAVLLAALLAATTVVATRSRHGRIATH